MVPWYYPTSALINATAALAIGSLVLIKNYKNKIFRNFALFNASVIVWSIGYFFWLLSKNTEDALSWSRVLMLGSNWITIFYYLFVVYLLDLRQKKIIFLAKLGVGSGIVFSFFTILTPLVVKSTRPMLTVPYWPMPGGLFPAFLVMFLFYSCFAAFLLFRHYRQEPIGQRKKQLRLVLIGTIIGYAGGCTNWPQWFGIDMLPIGNVTASIYSLTVGYAIIRYRFMEIETVAHRTLLWALTSLWLIIPVYMLFTLTRGYIVSLPTLWLSVYALLFFYGFLWYYHYFQPKIDHLFRRRKYDYQRVLSEIGQKFGGELDLTAIVHMLFSELRDVLYVTHGVLYLKEREKGQYKAKGSIGYEKDNDEQLSGQESWLRWLQEKGEVLEREEIEINKEYQDIRDESKDFFWKKKLELLIPLQIGAEVIGVLGLGRKENLQSYTIKDIELLARMGNQIGVSLDNAMHHSDIVEKERLAEELKLGQEIQSNLLPKRAPEVAGLTIEGTMLPAKEIGGDYYDYIVTSTASADDNRKVAIVIGDVSGKGVSAGLIMATAKATLRGLSEQGLSPKNILARANAILHEYTQGEKFMTMLYFEWDSVEKKLRYSSAGHEHIIIYRTGGKLAESLKLEAKSKDNVQNASDIQPSVFSIQQSSVEVIPGGGFMLGMLPEITEMLEDKVLDLQQGDKVILYTDGVTEAHNTKEEMYGLEHLAAAIETNGHRSGKELVTILKDSVYTFMGSREQYDDITLVVIGRE